MTKRMDAGVAEPGLSGQPCLGPEMGRIFVKTPSLGASSKVVNKDEVGKRVDREREEI